MFLDGSVVRFMGGSYNPQYPSPPNAIVDATNGLAYDLAGNSWSNWAYPSGTTEHIAHRYADDGQRIYFLKGSSDVSIYDRTAGWLEDDTAAMPDGLCKDAAVAWSGSEMIAWSGKCGSTASTAGGRYQPKAP
jgi:hypothetical protein